MLRSQLFLLCLFTGFSAACSGSSTDDPATTPPGGRPRSVEVATQWFFGAELDGLNSAMAPFRASHLDVDIVLSNEKGDDKVDVNARLAASEPLPDVFQEHVGFVQRHWVLHPDGNQLTPLDTFMVDSGLTDLLPRGIVDAAKVDGVSYSMPSLISRGNVLFYDKAIFQENDLQPPKTLEDFYAVGDALLGLPQPIIPLGCSSAEAGATADHSWGLDQHVQWLLLATQGPQFQTDYFSGKLAADDPGMRDVLEEFVRLTKYMDPACSSVRYPGELTALAEGKVAMVVQGMFGIGGLENQGRTLGVDFDVAPAPGNEGIFVAVTDGWVLFRDSPSADLGLELLRAMSSVESQTALATKFGSIPARSDVDLASLGPATARLAADLFTGISVPAITTGAVTPKEWVFAYDELLTRFLVDHDVESMVQGLRDNHKLLVQ